jgi:hypothetical protein
MVHSSSPLVVQMSEIKREATINIRNDNGKFVDVSEQAGNFWRCKRIWFRTSRFDFNLDGIQIFMWVIFMKMIIIT